jgi:hypothetical protein
VATAGSSGVPGNSGVLRGAAMSFGGAAGHLRGLADDLSGAQAASWSGPASIACSAVCKALSHSLSTGSDAFARASSALRQLADEIEVAQETAESALNAAAAADAEANRLSGMDEPQPDRIDSLLGQASGLLAVAGAARQQAEAAALVAAGIFADIAGMAPTPPPSPQPAEAHDDGGGGWFDSTVGFVKGLPGAAKDGYESANGWIDDREEDMDGLLDHLPGPLDDAAHGWWNTSIMSPKFNIDFAQGVGDWGVGMAETVPMLVRLSPQYGLIDPAGQREQQRELAAGMTYAWDHKAETGKTLVGWNHVENGEPGRMAGQLAPDVALAILTGGGSAAAKTADGARVVDRMAEAANTARRLDDFPALTREQQLAAEAWADSLPTHTTPTGTAAGRYEVQHTGPVNYTMEGGGVKIDADGFRPSDALALEAKHVGSPDASPYVPGSKAPEFIRTRVMDGVRDELERYRDIALSPDTPMRGVEVVTNDPRAVANLEALMRELGVPGRVVVRP